MQCLAVNNVPPKHECDFDFLVTTNHISPPTICVTNLTAGGPYALTGTNVEISVSGEAVPVVAGKHEIRGTPVPPVCLYVYPSDNHVCGKTNTYTATCSTNEVSPDIYTNSWTLSPGDFKGGGEGQSFSATNSVSSPGRYDLKADFTGSRKDCTNCTCHASGTTNCTVYQLTFTEASLVSSNLWVGLDRTDDGPTNQIRISEVKLVPDDPATNTWEIAGVCILTNTVGKETEYWTMDKEACSTSYLDQILKCTATVTNPPPGITLSVSTNFTVVKVDVILDGLVETNEEAVGAFLKKDTLTDYTGKTYDQDVGAWLKPVTIICMPDNLPNNERVTIIMPDPDKLYELKSDGKLYIAEPEYIANDVKNRKFFLQGRKTSSGLKDRKITVKHLLSEAIDIAKYTNVNIQMEPISAEAPEINPCGIVQGTIGRFKVMTVEPADMIAVMNWKVDSGPVTLVSDPKNLEVQVQANMSSGDFKLLLDFDKTISSFSTYNLPPAYIRGRVLQQTTPKIHFYVLANNDGSDLCTFVNLNVVNRYFKQAGIKFREYETTIIEDSTLMSSWAILWIGPLITPSDDEPVLKVFIVKSTGRGVGFTFPGNRIVIQSGPDCDIILTHELGHACGLDDIYTHSDIPLLYRDLTEDELKISIDKIPADHSGGKGQGYYFETVDTGKLINRQLMCGELNLTFDLAFGQVYGFPHLVGTPGLVSVGLMDMTTREPVSTY
jgi:hypothetical protein